MLYLVEPIDEVAIQNLQTYKEKKFVDISKEDLELGKYCCSFIDWAPAYELLCFSSCVLETQSKSRRGRGERGKGRVNEFDPSPK